jgi:propanol-preferring alcohol dehydrogenase
MARNGRIRVETTTYTLDQAVDVFDKLRAGQVKGRAVLTP